MTDEDAENYEDYIIPPDQQLILDKLNMPLITDQRANSNATTRLSHDLKKYTDGLTALLPTSDDHSITDTLLDDEFTDELLEPTKYHGTHHNTHTLVDETQQDGTDDDNNDDDDDDNDDIDPSGGFELDIVLNTQNTQNAQNTTVRRSMRNRVTITETLPDEPISSPLSRKDASTSPQSASLKTLSQNSDGNYPTESSASKRRNLDANWLTQPQTQDMMSQDMMSKDMMSYPKDTYSHQDQDQDQDQDPVTQASQILLPSAASPGRLRGGRKATVLGEKVAEDELYDETMIGRKIIKTFGRHGTFEGYVQHYCG
jgi:hypothetical protein